MKIHSTSTWGICQQTVPLLIRGEPIISVSDHVLEPDETRHRRLIESCSEEEKKIGRSTTSSWHGSHPNRFKPIAIVNRPAHIIPRSRTCYWQGFLEYIMILDTDVCKAEVFNEDDRKKIGRKLDEALIEVSLWIDRRKRESSPRNVLPFNWLFELWECHADVLREWKEKKHGAATITPIYQAEMVRFIGELKKVELMSYEERELDKRIGDIRLEVHARMGKLNKADPPWAHLALDIGEESQ